MQLSDLLKQVTTAMAEAGIPLAVSLRDNESERRGYLRDLARMISVSGVKISQLDGNDLDDIKRAVSYTIANKLIPGVHCHLVPFKGKYNVIVNSQGLYAMMEARPEVVHLGKPNLVFNGDSFSIEKNNNGDEVSHIVDFKAEQNLETLIGGYLCYELLNGSEQVFWLTKGRILERRAYADRGKYPSDLWKNWPLEAAEKTIIRALYRTQKGVGLLDPDAGFVTTDEEMPEVELNALVEEGHAIATEEIEQAESNVRVFGIAKEEKDGPDILKLGEDYTQLAKSYPDILKLGEDYSPQGAEASRLQMSMMTDKAGGKKTHPQRPPSDPQILHSKKTVPAAPAVDTLGLEDGLE